MKKDTHPTYHPKVKIKCACGAEYETGSTEEKLEVEICASCHPFYTGKERVVDTAGRVDKFKAKREAAEKAKKEEAERAKKRKEKAKAKKKEEKKEEKEKKSKKSKDDKSK